MLNERKKAIFLDRDGTINVDKDYLYKIEDFQFEPKADEALKILYDLGYILIVVTNQSGIARGYYSEEDVEILHQDLSKILQEKGIEISKFYYCPHHPEKGIGKYKVECQCRKPKTGMLDAAIKDLNIDVENSYMIGDTLADIDAGFNAGLTSILVKTGHGMETLEKLGDRKVEIYNSLYDFALKLK